MGFRDNVQFNEPTTPDNPLEQRIKKQLRSHPQQESEEEKDPFENYHVKARYGMFDLSQASDVAELENIITEVLARKKILRQEKWAHDKDGLTTVTLAWMDLTPKKKKKDNGPQGQPTFEDTM